LYIFSILGKSVKLFNTLLQELKSLRKSLNEGKSFDFVRISLLSPLSLVILLSLVSCFALISCFFVSVFVSSSFFLLTGTPNDNYYLILSLK